MEITSQNQQVLVIDDDERICRVYEELLTSRGWRVATCMESAQVVPRLKAERYALALLDIRMPGLEGTDLLPLIKKIQPELPVILISAYCEPKDAGYYQALGASAMIAKPFSHEALLDAVARATNHHAEIPLVLTTFSLRTGRDSVYRKLILAALQKTNWNQVKAAELLGVSRHCLIRWLKRLGIAY